MSAELLTRDQRDGIIEELFELCRDWTWPDLLVDTPEDVVYEVLNEMENLLYDWSANL